MNIKYNIPTDVSEPTKRFMKQVVGMLKELELIKGADEGALNILCYMYDNFLKAQEDIKENGILIETSRRKSVNPSVNVSGMCATQIIKLLREFGLSAKARASLNRMEESEEESPLEAFIRNDI